MKDKQVMKTTMEKVTLQEFKKLAYRAFYWTSFDPEKRGERTLKEHEDQLNDDLQNMPESETERYIQSYKKYFSEWLSAHSNCASSAITGGSGFNVRCAEKANNREHAKYEQFIEWREKALKSIAKKAETLRPQSEKDAEILNDWKKQVDRLFEGWLVDRFRSRLETVARKGNVELVNAVLDYLSEQQKEKGVILATSRHRVWTVGCMATKFRASIESAKTSESTETEINGVRVVRNEQADRIQLFFDGKPEPEMITKLKHAAFKWSPSNGCWQRQLTQNAIYATNNLLK